MSDMLLTTRVRERRIAHLEIHGWEPVAGPKTARHGIFHDGMGVGFSVRNDGPAGDSDVKRLERWHRDYTYEPCSWDELSDWHLDQIMNRLDMGGVATVAAV